MTVAQFIIHLLANNMGIYGKMLSISSNKAADMLTMRRIGLTIMMPPSKMTYKSLRVYRLNVRILLDDPCRRRGRRRA